METKNLLIQTAFLGDLLLSIPLIRSIRHNVKSPLALVCRRPFGQLFLDLQLVNEVYEVDKSSPAHSWGQVRTALKKQKWSTAWVPHQSFRTAWNVLHLDVNRRIGFRSPWNRFFFSSRIPRPLKFPDALRQLALVQNESWPESSAIQNLLRDSLAPSWAGIQTTPRIPSFASMDLSEEIDQFLKPRDELHLWKNIPKAPWLLAPGSQWATKRWGLEGYTEIAARLIKEGELVFLIGGSEDAPLGQKIKERVPGVESWIGRTSLSQLAVLMRLSKGLLCNDSGLMHMGSLCGLSTWAIFGPTTLELGYRPWQDRAQVIEHNLSCRPCGKHGHQVCPIGTHDCMKKVTANQVWASLKT